MSANPFPGWLDEVVADPIIVLPADSNAEARRNQWSFSLNEEQASHVSAGDVETFILQIVDARRAWLLSHCAGPMHFYCWHDEQAGQLRFSLVSCSPAGLPFHISVKAATSLVEIIHAWLSSPFLHGIPLTSEVSPSPPAPSLSVWSIVLPGS